MTPLLLFGLLLLNIGISAWNAYSVGAYWTESKIIGGWMRFVTWCGAVMSACGFTWSYFVIASMIGVSTGKLDPESAQLMFELGYLVIILPVIGSGLGITAHSIAVVYRSRRFGDIAIAGYNTFAQAHNMYRAAKDAPGILQHVIDGLGKKKSSKDSGGVVVVLLVIIMLCAGALTTAAIVRWADKRVALDVARA